MVKPKYHLLVGLFSVACGLSWEKVGYVTSSRRFSNCKSCRKSLKR